MTYVPPDIDDIQTEWALNSVKQASDRLKSQAQQKLIWTDSIANRCIKDGTTYNQDWKNYTDLLRNVVNGVSNQLPNPPINDDGSIKYPT